MKRSWVMLTSLLILGAASLALAGPNEDVGAATQAWIDGMNSHDAEKWLPSMTPRRCCGERGLPRSVTPLPLFVTTSRFSRPFYRRTGLSSVSSGFGSTATLQSTPGPTRFPRIATVSRLPVQHGSALSIGIAPGVG